MLLKEEFNILLTNEEIEAITTNLNQLDKPILDKPLNQLIESIDEIPDAGSDNKEQYQALYFFACETDISLDKIDQNAIILVGEEGKEKIARFIRIIEAQGDNPTQKEFLPQAAKITLSNEEQAFYAGIKGKFNLTDKLPPLRSKLIKQDNQTIEEQTKIDRQNAEITKENQKTAQERAKLTSVYKGIFDRTIGAVLLNSGLTNYKPKATSALKNPLILNDAKKSIPQGFLL